MSKNRRVILCFLRKLIAISNDFDWDIPFLILCVRITLMIRNNKLIINNRKSNCIEIDPNKTVSGMSNSNGFKYIYNII